MEHKFKDFQKLESKESLSTFIERFRVVAKNEKSNNENLIFIEKVIEKCKQLDDKKSLVKVYEIKVSLIEHLFSRASEISEIASAMKDLSNEINYIEGLALSYNVEWYIEKIKGNTEKSKKALSKSIAYIEKISNPEKYAFHVCMYSLAVEKWLSEHDIESSTILEECSSYFFEEGYHRSLAQTFGLLSIIYTRTHDSKKALNISKRIFSDRILFDGLAQEVKGMIYYFVGLGYMLDANLRISESYFQEAYSILKPIYLKSDFYGYFIVLHSYLATVTGLLGKTKQAIEIDKLADTLLQTEFIQKNIDINTKKQILHTHNLVKFYNISRLSNYNSQEHQKLIDDIFANCKDLFSDFMTLSEFILNSNLDTDKLQQLLEIDNFSVNRIKYLIEFMLEKQQLEREISQEQRVLNCISILEKRVKTKKTTFMENVYANLLIAQQLFTLKRYAEISPLLKQYENKLHRIEVLEMRIFMEAFIQVGAYKNGDPLGPALQYMAIKKCRLYGFSRLENTLLKYLQLQQEQITRTV
jgi:hypothetical protein